MKPAWWMLRAGVAASLLLAGSAGCVARTAVGTGNVLSKFRGDSEAIFIADARTVTTAAENAVRDLDLDVMSAAASGIDGVVVARTAQRADVQISIRGEHLGQTRVWVWVGPAGDEPLQERLLEAMRTRLGLPPRRPDPAHPPVAGTTVPAPAITPETTLVPPPETVRSITPEPPTATAPEITVEIPEAAGE